MDTCIKCGKPIPDGELFCAECSLNPAAAAPEHAPHRAEPAQGRMQKPVRRPAAQHAAVAAPAVKIQSKTPRGVIAALVLLALLAAGLLTLVVLQYVNGSQWRNELRVQESSLDAREQELEDLYAQVETLSDALDEAEYTIDTQNDTIKALTARAETAESTASQSQYDADTQLAELERITQENIELRLSVEAGEAENEKLTKSVDELSESVQTLTQENSSLRKKSDFVDSYIVFVENDKSGLYHRYDCAHFVQKSFWAYSRKLAERNGYEACPDCFGG